MTDMGTIHAKIARTEGPSEDGPSALPTVRIKDEYTEETLQNQDSRTIAYARYFLDHPEVYVKSINHEK